MLKAESFRVQAPRFNLQLQEEGIADRELEIVKGLEPWHVLVEVTHQGEVNVVLLPEAHPTTW